MVNIIHSKDILPDLENRLIAAFIDEHRCRARVINGTQVDLEKVGNTSNYFTLSISQHGTFISRSINCNACGYYEGVHLLERNHNPAYAFFSDSEIETLAHYMDSYHPSVVASRLGLEKELNSGLKFCQPSYNVDILGLHVGIWQKTILIGARVDFTDYDYAPLAK